MNTRTWRPMLVALSALALGPAALAQQSAPEWTRALAKNPDDPALKAQKDLRKKQMRLEKELKKLRYAHFRSEHQATRAEGVRKLSEYREGWMVQPLVEVFQEETSDDIRAAVIADLREARCDESDRALAWLCVSNTRGEWRDAAISALKDRLVELKDKPSTGMLAVLEGAVMSLDQNLADNGAHASKVLNLYEMIPFLIQGQTPPPPASAGPIGRPRNGPLAWIAIAQQQVYIADLNPIVADNSVAWDPVPGVVSSGVVLVINDAVVHFNPTAIHRNLVDLSSRLAGRPTDGLGMRFSNWQNWYRDGGEQAVAKAAEKRAEDRAKAEAAVKAEKKPEPTPTAPTAPADPASPAR